MDSQAIVNTMEVLETKPLNELVTEATVKVCYVSELPNPNRTVIDRKTGKEIAATLPGAPVVGLFDNDTNDFVEHSRKVSIKDGEIKWEELTRPYGFVSPIHKPWYQDFMEDGEKRTYLMCKAFLWTRQYREASLIDNKGQSMELNEKDMSGYYEGDVFVFTHATLDKLCILGDKYSPCFEGAKFMTTYAKSYQALADQIENIIGRRYYVLNNELVEKPITLEYALQLGWNLEEAIYAQLVNRGAEQRYRIQGIYTESGEVFTILQETASQEYVKVAVEITGENTVELGTEMTAVSMEWVTKQPKDETRVVPLNDSEAQATETPASTASAMQNGTSNYSAENSNSDNEDTTSNAENIQDQNATAATPTTVGPDEPATMEEGQQIANDGISQAAAVINESGKTTDMAPENVELVTQETGSAIAPVDSSSNEGTPVNEGAASNEPGSGEGGENAAPADFTALTEKVNNLEKQLAEKDTQIAGLEAVISEYKKKDEEAQAIAKKEMIASYKSMLSEDEMQPIVDNLSTFSLDEIESKLSVTYARKQRALAAQDNGGIQVNISSINDSDNDMPEFMKQAAEYDRIHGLNINI